MTTKTELTADNDRQQFQLDFLASGQDIEVGTLSGIPFSIEELTNVTSESPFVLDSFQGLTNHVFKITDGTTNWTLKRKRDEILVKNVDGQTSFLNEVQRRRDFAEQKKIDPQSFQHIIDTQYASLKRGIILSPWIEGEHITEFNAEMLDGLFATLIELELNGFCEWDLCSGNLLAVGNNVKLYDFGYMYRFDPLTMFNSNGTADPIFHCAERFETRFFFSHLHALEQQDQQAALTLYSLEKDIALKHYQQKYRVLEQASASPEVLKWLYGINQLWEQGLSSPEKTADLYRLESHRSMVLDLMDDLHGKSCTPGTLTKADTVLDNLKNHFRLLKEKAGLFFGDEEKSQDELIEIYQKKRALAVEYQL
tara:strand:+ start:2101 stop:3201 length:1101 start_codon:yes stop_codon:yes gene_type:complete